MYIIKNFIAAIIVSVSFTSGILAQNLSNANDVNCYPNYIYVQGASTRIGFINKSTCDYTYCEWNFGDGITASSKNAVHEYKTPGFYLLRLVVGSETSKDTLYQIINVHNPLSYNATYASGNNTNNDSFQLTARSQAALFDCFDKFFADAVLVSSQPAVTPAGKQAAERNW